MLLREHSENKDHTFFPTKESMENHLVENMINTIEENIKDKITVCDLCSKMNYSRAYLSGIFKASTGMTIGEYITNIKIKEALCEYGKYPYYLEHYFMTSRVDYKLKGKFNLRCLAKLNNLPDIIYKYINKDDLDYINNEVMIQGKDMIIKNGKIISSGDVYLVGIELSNDTMFKVPPTKIVNKALLNVIDFQQFDNVYSRVELLLDDSGITDYIVKPLALENIGTLKNMKYINFY